MQTKLARIVVVCHHCHEAEVRIKRSYEHVPEAYTRCCCEAHLNGRQPCNIRADVWVQRSTLTGLSSATAAAKFRINWSCACTSISKSAASLLRHTSWGDQFKTLTSLIVHPRERAVYAAPGANPMPLMSTTIFCSYC